MSLARTPLALRAALRPRALHTTALRLADTTGPTTKTADPSGTPQTTQGHTTTKSHGLDVQNANANAGQAEHDKSGGDGDAQPIDAARMGGGESKPGMGKGAFKDQVGGQAAGGASGGSGGGGGDVKKGGETEVPDGGWMGKVKNALGGNKAFHTSARAGVSGSRKPVEKGLEGEQNEHLKHKAADAPDSGKGNAASEPHLPSHNSSAPSSGAAESASKEQTAANPAQAGKASGAPKGFASLHTSARAQGDKERKIGYAATHEGEPKKAGYDAPPEALPANLESTYNRAEATPPPLPNLTPSSEAEYSSTGQEPPIPALKEQIKQGGLPPRNPQPSAEGGRQGLGEAWKNRNIS